MTTSELSSVESLAEQSNIATTLYDGYSGRCMYGEKTAALVVKSRGDLNRLCKRARGRGIYLRTDSLGMDYIAY